MSRSFAYLRVSTLGQTTDNQLGEIRAAGFEVQPHRVVAETVSREVNRRFERLSDVDRRCLAMHRGNNDAAAAANSPDSVRSRVI